MVLPIMPHFNYTIHILTLGFDQREESGIFFPTRKTYVIHGEDPAIFEHVDLTRVTHSDIEGILHGKQDILCRKIALCIEEISPDFAFEWSIFGKNRMYTYDCAVAARDPYDDGFTHHEAGIYELHSTEKAPTRTPAMYSFLSLQR